MLEKNFKDIMKKEGRLFIISGPSGVGKGTLIKKILNSNPEILYSISLTTRPKRENETEGKEYFFVSKEEFKKKIKENKLLEWAKVYGYYYGTPKEFIYKNIKKGKDIILEIDCQGAKKIRRTMKKNTVFIFIAPPNLKELKNRLLKRGNDSKKEILIRLKSAKNEMKEIKNYDYLVVNDEIEKASEILNSIIKAEKFRIRRE
jgi:guanylate kinase